MAETTTGAPSAPVGKFTVGEPVKVKGSSVTGVVTIVKKQANGMVYEVKRCGNGSRGTYLESQLEPPDAKPRGIKP